jgi:hypothetical protein
MLTLTQRLGTLDAKYRGATRTAKERSRETVR